MASSSSVKYPNPTGVNVGDFVTVKLTPQNYYEWKSMMVDLLKSHGLNGFIDGSIPPPPEKIGETENQDYLEWKKSDELVRRWILSTLNDTILIFVHRLPITAKELWITTEKVSKSLQYSIDDIDNEHIRRPNIESKYIPLLRATLDGDWKKAVEFLDEEPSGIRTFITPTSETVLMVAARSTDDRPVDFVKKLLCMMDPQDLTMCNYHGSTALHMAASSGNIDAARLLVEKNPSLPYIYDYSISLPLHMAVLFGKRKMVLYLWSVTKEDVERGIFEGESGIKLVRDLVNSELYDIALAILQSYPRLASDKLLRALARTQSAFKSGTRFNFYQRFIYSWVPIAKLENISFHSTISHVDRVDSVKQRLRGVFWKNIAKITVLQIRSIQDTKTTNYHALALVKFLCSEIAKFDFSKASVIFRVPVENASSLGVSEIIEEILASFPSALYLRDEMGRTLFHLAIINRRENIFNIIYQVGQKHVLLGLQDKAMDNCLHLAGLLERQQQLDLMEGTVGSALPMQRELQWFKAVEDLMLKTDKEQRNAQEKTPAMVFTESHEELVRYGGEWMKIFSSSCTIAATLVVTIVFAAAITVPASGNNSNDGYPFFRTSTSFKVFAVSDALAFFASTSSLLVFLSIYTSLYGQQHFMYAVPKRLIIGLISLFLAIIFMMIAFGAIIQIMFGQGRPWLPIPVVAFSCVPITLLICLQFPLLWDMIKSTYGHSIFGKQSNRML